MNAAALLAELVELADAAGLRVQLLRTPAGSEAEAGVSSAVCRVRGEVRIVLVASDPLEARIEVVAAALREHAGDWIERRYLSPAVRARLGAGLP